MSETDPARGRTESPILELLASYHAVLGRAERLPTFVWLHSRPPRVSAISRLKLPRLTLGTSMLVRHHVLRSVDALLRDHAARAALGDLDDLGVSDRAALTDFRASVRPVPWRRVIFSVILAALIIGRGIVELLIGSLHELAFGLTKLDLDQEAKARAAADALLALSSSLSASSVSGTASQLAHAGSGTLAVLAAGLLASAYVVLRPFASAFRMKRILFNLASTPEVDLTDTCTTWHVTRSLGLYDAERSVLREVELPHEKPFDLTLSVIATGLVCTAAASATLTDATPSDLAVFAALVLAPGVLRLAWLARSYLDRSDGTTGRELPEYCRLPATTQLVDRRAVSESVGWSLLVGPLVWFRLARQADRLAFEQAARTEPKARLRGPWLALGSAVLMYLAAPLALLFSVSRLHSLSRVRWIDYAVVSVLLSSWVAGFWVVATSGPESQGETIGVVVVVAIPALCAGFRQALTNRLVSTLAGELTDIGSAGAAPTPLSFNPPPGWPAPRAGWTPPARWRPDAAWPKAPLGWQAWLPGRAAQ